MGLTIGIVGLPNVGKSTLFNALTKNNILAANYPFATIEPNVGIVGVPDVRVAELAKVYRSERVIEASVTFVDIAGIVKGASEGNGLGNQFLANIREADAICQVVRVFEDSDVVHVDGRISPSDDIETINTELILADIQTLEKAIPRLEKRVRTDKEGEGLLAEAKKAFEVLGEGVTVFQSNLDVKLLSELSLLTAKPFMYVFNVDENGLEDEKLQSDLREKVMPARAVFLNAQLEFELSELSEQDAKELLASIGQEQFGLSVLAHAGFETLGLQSYFTAGPKEARAWTIKKGATAPEAAGVIHTDFQKGFIKAEVVSYDDLIECVSLLEARNKGKARIEGKEYVMQDGDVVEFRHNVSM